MIREVSIKNSDVEGLKCQHFRRGLMDNNKSARGIMKTAVREVNSGINKDPLLCLLLLFDSEKKL